MPGPMPSRMLQNAKGSHGSRRFSAHCKTVSMSLTWAGGLEKRARAYPLLMESKARSKFLFYRVLSENRIALGRTR